MIVHLLSTAVLTLFATQALATVSLGVAPGDRPVGFDHAGRSPVFGANGMAATAEPLASQVAIDVLKRGGTAVDAAIAANAMLSLLDPMMCGPGGDLFAIVWDPKTKKLIGLNGSGRAPMDQTYDALRARLGDSKEMPNFGALSVTVPGAVDGWFMLHDRFGKLPMKDVLAPAIAYAREGVPISPVTAYEWAAAIDPPADYAKEIEEIANMRALYAPGGHAPKAGDIFRNPDLANTLELIAKHGRGAFYEGSIAKTIDQYMRRVGGPITAADLAAHHGDWVTPMSANYRGYDVYELPPNGQGLAALEMLKILEGYDLKSIEPGSADYWHLVTEAKKLAYVDRGLLYSDPATAQTDWQKLIAPAHIDALRAQIKSDKAIVPRFVDDARIASGDTVYLTVADKDGMMVSLIQSVAGTFGSYLVPDGLGFALQNRADFNLDPAHANVYAPGKRPFHTIIPAFVMKDGAPLMSFGVMGGSQQPQGHVQVLLNIIDYGMDIQAAGDAARVRHEGPPAPGGSPEPGLGTLNIESGIGADVRAELAKRGHRIGMRTDIFYGGYQAILRDPTTGVYQGASEMRQDGAAVGY